MQCVYRSDFPSLQNFWMYLYRRFFSQLNNESLTMAYRLETNVLRYENLSVYVFISALNTILYTIHNVHHAGFIRGGGWGEEGGKGDIPPSLSSPLDFWTLIICIVII